MHKIKKILGLLWILIVGLFVLALWSMPLMIVYLVFTKEHKAQHLALFAKTCRIVIAATYMYNTLMIIKTKREDDKNDYSLVRFGILILIFVILQSYFGW